MGDKVNARWGPLQDATALVLLLSFSLPVYLARVVLPVASQFPMSAPPKSSLYVTEALSFRVSLLCDLFLVLTLFTSSILLHLLSAMPKKESLEDFLQQAREKGSDIKRGLLMVLQSRNTSNLRPSKTTREF